MHLSRLWVTSSNVLQTKNHLKWRSKICVALNENSWNPAKIQSSTRWGGTYGVYQQNVFRRVGVHKIRIIKKCLCSQRLLSLNFCEHNRRWDFLLKIGIGKKFHFIKQGGPVPESYPNCFELGQLLKKNSGLRHYLYIFL